jgi:hypothetical protein
MPFPGMGRGSEDELAGGRPVASVGTRTLLRRVLWIAGTALGFVLLAVLGLGVGSLFSFGDSVRPEPEPAPVARPTRPPPERPPPPPAPPPTPLPTPAVAIAAPPPPPAAPVARPLLPSPSVPLPDRLRLRRDVLKNVAALKEELARCPAEPVIRSPPGARAALVLDTVAEGGALRVVGSHLDAEGPVNDRFITCARSVLEGKRFPVSGPTSGERLQLFLPLGPKGNAISLNSASLKDPEPP